MTTKLERRIFKTTDLEQQLLRSGYRPIYVKNINKMAERGFHFCASCGAQMKLHRSGHCFRCRKLGLD